MIRLLLATLVLSSVLALPFKSDLPSGLLRLQSDHLPGLEDPGTAFEIDDDSSYEDDLAATRELTVDGEESEEEFDEEYYDEPVFYDEI